MLNADSQPQARSSPPLIDSEFKDVPRTPHPPRLQHSPSLPNIWSSHHSNPISREKGDGEGQNMQRPSAPSSPKSKPPAAVIDKDLQIRHVKYASIDRTYRKPSGSKTHARRRTERDEPHSLLTPPLTPSSSIRTTASVDSTANTRVVHCCEPTQRTNEEILDPDTDSTRILLLENISPTTANHYLESALVDALTSAVSEYPAVNDRTYPSAELRDIVKGINTLRRDKGIVPVVFFDVRQAKIARDIILNKKLEERLRMCIGGRGDGGDLPMELTARYITREKLCEELCETLGNSRFLDGIESSFSFSVRKIQQECQNQDEISCEEQCDQSWSSNDPPSMVRGGVNVLILQNILKMFGSIRFFKFIQQEVDKQGLSTIIYHVEYHDVRDAETAYHDLQNKDMFGMNISVLKRPNGAEVEVDLMSGGSIIEPFPNSATAGESFGGLKICSAGTQSHMRHRFVNSSGDENPVREQTTVPSSGFPSNIPSGGANSPPYFYTTMPFDESSSNLQVAHNNQGPAHIRTANTAIFSRPVMQEQQWESDALYHIPPSYSPDGLCHYCPSRGPSHNMQINQPFPSYSFLASPPTSPMYYQGHLATPPILPSIINVSSNPGVSMSGYEYMDARIQPMPYAGGWGYDPAIAPFSTGMTAPSPVPFFHREEMPNARGADRHPIAYMCSPSQPNVSQPRLEIEPVPPQSTCRTRHLITPASVLPSRDCSAAPVSVDTSTSAANHSPVHDRNQLKLERIISGEDTRTTIMIKNIPNKMSDSDLTTYIGKVCPRKIDFLYLRMDFKNGCNVGYAFVNFIDVEALIHFAKERLGAKWNMFSSEKVLQMSYANYQGKEALIEKFKNSAIMDERESWRPRIFYSLGDDQGLPQPFPAPTHIGRKERSSFNRDTLFPRGVNSHTIAAKSHGLLQNTPRRNVDDMQRARRNKLDHVQWGAL